MPEGLVVNFELREFGNGGLGVSLFQKLVNIVFWVAPTLKLLLFGLFSELVLVGLVGNDPGIFSSDLPFLIQLLSTENSISKGLEAVVASQDVPELEASDSILLNQFDEALADLGVLHELLNDSSGVLNRLVGEVLLPILVTSCHEANSHLLILINELEVIIELTHAVDVVLDLIDEEDLVLGKQRQVFEQVLSVEPF